MILVRTKFAMPGAESIMERSERLRIRSGQAGGPYDCCEAAGFIVKPPFIIPLHFFDTGACWSPTINTHVLHFIYVLAVAESPLVNYKDTKLAIIHNKDSDRIIV